VAIAGAGGSGKSTLGLLLSGHLEVTQGSIQLGGHDVREANLDSWRGAVVLVTDQPDILAGTIEENLRLGRDEIPLTMLRRALAQVALDTDIDEMPRGLSTPLISEGRNLSRSQVLRLLLARALVGQPAVLVLDDILGALEPALRTKILAGLRTIAGLSVIHLTSHPDVASTCDSVVRLVRGTIEPISGASQTRGTGETESRTASKGV
jgi:ABC-type multidrug transport system fused ATPase/permease subunit